MPSQSRREFIQASSTLLAGTAIASTAFAKVAAFQSVSPTLCVFTKCLQFLDHHQLGDALAKIGFQGADIPVRKGGYILPENVEKELPEAIRTLKRAGIGVPMIVTGINDPGDPYLERILGTASQNGVAHYRMGPLKYDPLQSVPQNLDRYKKTMEELSILNHKFGIHGEFQNHAGKGVGAPVWDLYWMLKDSDPEKIGVQYDIRHAVCEGGNSWSLGMSLLAPWIKSIDIKDFVWYQDSIDSKKWKIKNVPLGEGMVDYDAFLKEYVRLQLKGPISIHYEYDLGGAEHGGSQPTMGLAKISDYLKKDLDWLKGKLKAHKIL